VFTFFDCWFGWLWWFGVQPYYMITFFLHFLHKIIVKEANFTGFTKETYPVQK
jgi:hypothetical protein